MSRRFARLGWPSSYTRHAGTITGSATPHAEGAYSQIVAALAADVCMIVVAPNTDVSQPGVDTSMLLSFAVGAAASEVDIISNIAQGGSMGVSAFRPYQVFLPIHIPAGARLSAKLRAEQVSDTYLYDVHIYYGSRIPGWGGYSICTTLGADTANSKGTTISNTAGTWTTISSSTPRPIRAFNYAFGLVDATVGVATHTVDVGVGGAGSEVIIGSCRIQTTASEQLHSLLGPMWLEVAIPEGSRIAMKKDTTEDLSGVVLGWS